MTQTWFFLVPGRLWDLQRSSLVPFVGHGRTGFSWAPGRIHLALPEAPAKAASSQRSGRRRLLACRRLEPPSAPVHHRTKRKLRIKLRSVTQINFSLKYSAEFEQPAMFSLSHSSFRRCVQELQKSHKNDCKSWLMLLHVLPLNVAYFISVFLFNKLNFLVIYYKFV